MYASAAAITRDIAEILRPPRRVSVSRCASEVVRIETPGGYSGAWDPELTPYMVEPMDALKSRRHEAVVFVAPARSGKTQGLLDGWLAHCVTADPGDMGLYFSTQMLAYDFRKRRIERMHRNSEQLRAKLSPRKHDTTTEMIIYRNGMILNLGWPTSSQLAQRDLRYVALSDYDSFPDEIPGEGEPFGLAKKRVEVAMSAGMALVESSPKREMTTNNWIPDGPHAAPPVKGGVLALYNRGDRHRWYWECLDGCNERFEAPALPLFDEHADVMEAAASARVACPHCGCIYRPRDKRKLNASGKWIAESTIVKSSSRGSTIASFWMRGAAAAFQPWESIVANELRARRELEATGDEAALRQTRNTDQGVPYMPAAMAEASGAQSLAARKEDLARYTVPPGVRFLVASVDVQANRFEVAIIGYGQHGERWLIDRFAILKTADGDPLRPAVMREHWDVLTDRVVNATYTLDDAMEMRVHFTGVDSGGYHHRKRKADSTAKAYDWWRQLRRDGIGHRVRLLKGAASKNAPPVKETYPDSRERSDRQAGSRGDVPVIMLNPNRLKDVLATDLAREVAGPGYIHLPAWMEKRHREELTAEQRMPDGWQPIGNRRNETLDLFVYASAIWRFLRADKIRWSSPPPWAAVHKDNANVMSAGQRRELKSKYDRIAMMSVR